MLSELDSVCLQTSGRCSSFTVFSVRLGRSVCVCVCVCEILYETFQLCLHTPLINISSRSEFRPALKSLTPLMEVQALLCVCVCVCVCDA